MKLALADPMGFALCLEKRYCHTHGCKNQYDVRTLGSGLDHGLQMAEREKWEGSRGHGSFLEEGTLGCP